jgi:hypothetical protein
MHSAMASRGGYFVYRWIQDTIVAKTIPAWDLELVVEMKFMCIAEANAVGITQDELEEAAQCELEMLLIGALDKAESGELVWDGKSGMPSTAQH